MKVTISFSGVIIHAFILYLYSNNVQLLPQGEYNEKEIGTQKLYFKWSGNIINKECKNINTFNNNLKCFIIITICIYYNEMQQKISFFIINCISRIAWFRGVSHNSCGNGQNNNHARTKISSSLCYVSYRTTPVIFYNFPSNIKFSVRNNLHNPLFSTSSTFTPFSQAYHTPHKILLQYNVATTDNQLWNVWNKCTFHTYFKGKPKLLSYTF